MSPHAVNNFVTDLVEMAKAVEELPQVRTALAEAQAESETQRHTISLREESILKLKAEIEALNDRNHKLEAERDDAELRFLELEEKYSGLTKLIQAAASAVGMVDKPEPAPVNPQTEAHQAISEAAQEHEPMPAGDMAQPQGQSATDPTTAPNPSSSETQTAGTSGAHSAESTSTDPLPSAVTGTTSPSPDAPSAPAAPMSDASGSGGSEGKYAAAIWSELSSAVHDDFWRSLEIARNRRTITAQDFWIENGGSIYGWQH